MTRSGEYDPTLPEASGADTIEPRRASQPQGPVSERRGAIEGYYLKDVIGRGGMGEVTLARDPRMERDVAIKRMLTTRSTDAEERFLREAKVQARLDHPAIVPVYELGRDSEDQPFFVMKKIGGTTMATLLERGGASTRLLRAVVDVCLAIDLAHSRQIVHRDLKPANIILGDHGEVYVLDWGVARLLDETSSLAGVRVAPSHNSGTQAGQILGTPGYMAPEQMLGGDVDTSADVYSLGAILFEILAGESLHPRGGGAIGSTLAGVETSPAERAAPRDVPFELDNLCREALVTDPKARPSARQLADRIQGYLDGDRDMAQRRAMAIADLAAARDAFAAGDRALTMKLAGRAITLDPKLTEAVELVTAVLLEPPTELPPDVVTRLAEEEVRQTRERSRRAIGPFLAFFALLPVIPLMNIRNGTTLAIIFALVAGEIAIAVYQWRVRLLPLAIFLVYQLVLLAGFSRLVGPFVLTPVLCAGAVLSFASIPWLNERPLALSLWAAATLLIPVGAETLGLMDSSWELQASPAGLLDHGTVFAQNSNTDGAIVMMANVGMVMLVAAYARAIASDRRKAQRQLYLQSWHLEQLLPKSRANP